MLSKMPKWLIRLVSFVLSIVKKCNDDQVSAYAAQSAFFFLMSVFPFSIFLLQIIKFAPISQESLLLTVDSIFPTYLLPTVHEILQEIYSSSRNYMTITIVTTLWAASNAMYAMASGLDRIRNLQQAKGFIYTRLLALVYTLIFSIMIIMAIGITVAWGEAKSILLFHRPSGVSLYLFSTITNALYSNVLLTLLFALMYKIFPHRKERYLRQLPGAFLAAVGCYLSSFGITFYVSHFNVASTYGSLTTLALVMFWLYFCNYSVMIGAELNAVIFD